MIKHSIKHYFYNRAYDILSIELFKSFFRPKLWVNFHIVNVSIYVLMSFANKV